MTTSGQESPCTEADVPRFPEFRTWRDASGDLRARHNGTGVEVSADTPERLENLTTGARIAASWGWRCRD